LCCRVTLYTSNFQLIQLFSIKDVYNAGERVRGDRGMRGKSTEEEQGVQVKRRGCRGIGKGTEQEEGITFVNYHLDKQAITSQAKIAVSDPPVSVWKFMYY
jgi:hypothetical protein